MLQVAHLALNNHRQPLLQAVNFTVAPGEVLTLMGPSGCGKSSLLHWMIGALPPGMTAQGELWLAGARIDHLPTTQRRCGILFQAPLLFPHLSVGDNLLVALPAGSGNPRQRIARAETALAHAGLGGFFHRDPATLSGGQSSRVSLLRALLAEPRALLLDEPFSRLDSTLRADFRQWVFSRVAERAIPVIQVTHDAQDIPPGGRALQMAQWAPAMR
ncbi:ATP-binding cassette domain-containing protein [Shimwellia pseudoproteus]|uniref:ATP-binding cassette domain-containing protein n=1 Tax=Shimwellia pseudoproteus TaxID=570012 RepID=UPI0018EBA445|nr:ATP-binding cassette domain-containing protein [Shimwellia pseudoproteus]MBJ3813952.1 ATP-binding cassette domain-containing protein [Shimwellia pseudoproteus]